MNREKKYKTNITCLFMQFYLFRENEKPECYLYKLVYHKHDKNLCLENYKQEYT